MYVFLLCFCIFFIYVYLFFVSFCLILYVMYFYSYFSVFLLFCIFRFHRANWHSSVIRLLSEKDIWIVQYTKKSESIETPLYLGNGICVFKIQACFELGYVILKVTTNWYRITRSHLEQFAIIWCVVDRAS